MSHAGVLDAVHPSWNDRFFERLPWPPAAIGCAIALLLVVLIVAASALFGELIEFLTTGRSLMSARDARIAVTVALLAGYLPAARRYLTLELEERLPEIGATVGRELQPLPLRMRGGALGLLLLPAVAYAIDGRIDMYASAIYWRTETLWHWVIGAFCTWNSGMLIGTAVRELRRVSELADEIPSIDLLDLAELRPFARLGQRFALFQIGIAAIFALNIIEFALVGAIALIFAFTLCYAIVCVALPALGANRRIRSEKQQELERVNRAIRGEAGALRGSLIETGSRELDLADLLAYREVIGGVSEWPIDAPMRLRILLYSAIPVVSWLGGVIVEWFLQRTLG